jgi:hypothetical protein
MVAVLPPPNVDVYATIKHDGRYQTIEASRTPEGDWLSEDEHGIPSQLAAPVISWNHKPQEKI